VSQQVKLSRGSVLYTLRSR